VSDLLPTGTCFDDALEYLNERVLADPSLAERSTLVLVHGIARSTDGADEPYAHAWCEEAGQAWDAALWNGQRIYYAVARAAFYEARRIADATQYTIRQACLLNYATRHYGPWLPRYRALCGQGGRVMGRHAADASGATVRSWGDK